MLLDFCAVAFTAFPRSRSLTFGLLGLGLYAAGYVVAAFFPCDPGGRPEEPSTSQLMHNLGGLAGYVFAPAALFALAKAARQWPRAAYLSVTGYVGAAVALAGLLTLSPESEFVGLSQRAIEASVLLWMVIWGGGRSLTERVEQA